jgi:hypothetical protein
VSLVVFPTVETVTPECEQAKGDEEKDRRKLRLIFNVYPFKSGHEQNADPGYQAETDRARSDHVLASLLHISRVTEGP